MSDDRIGADYGSADYVGDVWHDDHADGTDGRRRRLFVATVLCAAREEELRSRKRKRR